MAVNNEKTDEKLNEPGNDKADEKADNKPDEKKEEKGSEKPEGKVFTDEAIAAIKEKEAKAARKAMLEEFGYKNEKELKADVDAQKVAKDAQKSQEEKDAEATAENERKLQEAAAKAMKAEMKAEAMILGVKPDCVEDVIMIAIGKTSDDGDYKTTIAEIKTKYPMFFVSKADEDDDANKGKKGTGSSVSSKTGAKGKESDKEGLGARLAVQRKANKAKKSFWS